MALVDRVKNILLTPKTEWPVIEGENTSTADLLKNYVAILAAIPAVCGFIGMSLIGMNVLGVSVRTPILWGLVSAVLNYVMAFVGVIVVGHIIDALAPTFGGTKNLQQATKVAVYSFTAAWIGGIFSILPLLSVLGIITAIYSIYLLYLGLPRLMKSPDDKAVGYTAVVVIVAIVVFVVIGAVVGAVTAIGGGAAGALSTGSTSASSTVAFDKDSTAGKLDDFAKKMEEANQKMEAAQKSGNQEEAAKAAMAALGTALSGGKSVDPVAIEQLKPFVPETLAGLPKKSSNAEKTGALGIMVSKAEASYGDATGKQAMLEVSDTGGASGLMSLASWMNVQGEKEDASGSERTQKVNGRIVHERASKTGGENEYTVVLGDRFVVSAKGTVDLASLKSAVSALDLAKLEAMKDVGVQK